MHPIMGEEVPPALTERGGSLVYVFLISLVAAIGGLLFGYDLTVISSAIIYMEKEFGLSAAQSSFAMSSATLGCLIGPFLAGSISNRLGRKESLMIAGLLFAAGAIGTALPKDMFTFNIFRVAGGLGVGLASVVSPMYIAEVAPARLRGLLVTLNQLAIVIGSLISFFAAFAFDRYIPGTAWRWMFASAAIPSLGLILGLIFVPQSPRWLAQKGRWREAQDVLSRIDGEQNAREELKSIQESFAQERGRLREFFQKGLRLALLIGVGLAFFQQWTGVSTILFYAPKIYQKAGFFAPNQAILQSIYMNIWNLVCTIVALMLVDRLGRRPLLLIGCAGMAIGQALLGVAFFANLKGIYIAIAMYLCIGFYVTSLAPLAWLIMSEIFPTRLRAVGMSMATMVVWISAFSSVYVLGPLMEYLEKNTGTPAGAFWIFAGFCVIAFLFSWRLIPETKGRTLEEISRMWLEKKK